MTLNCQCIGSVDGGRCQTGQGSYDLVVALGCVVQVGERERERERECVLVRRATHRKPSHNSATHNAAEKVEYLLKNERKVNDNYIYIYIWLVNITYLLHSADSSLRS